MPSKRSVNVGAPSATIGASFDEDDDNDDEYISPVFCNTNVSFPGDAVGPRTARVRFSLGYVLCYNFVIEYDLIWPKT